MVPFYIKNCVGSAAYLYRNVEFLTRHVLFCMVWRIRFNTSMPSESTVAPKSNLIRLGLAREWSGVWIGPYILQERGLCFVSQSTDFSFCFVPFRFAKYRFFISFRPISFLKVQFFHFVLSHFVLSHFVSSHFVSSHFVSSHLISFHFVSQSTDNNPFLARRCMADHYSVWALRKLEMQSTGGSYNPVAYTPPHPLLPCCVLYIYM